MKLNSGGRNSISQYLCYTGKNLTCRVMSAKILWATGGRAPCGAAVAVKRDSAGRNPFSHYPCYGKLTSSVPKPSSQFTVTFGSSSSVTFGSSSTVIFDQVGKASLRIKILCQYNKGKAKLHSDHRNATSRQCSPQGRQCSPQARVRSTLGQHNKGSVKMNSDHQNSFSRQPLPAGGILGVAKTERKCYDNRIRKNILKSGFPMCFGKL